MAKNKTVDKAQIKRLIAAFRRRKIPQMVPAAQLAEIRRLRHKLNDRLQSLFVKSGLDVGKIDKLLAAHQRDLLRVAEKNRAKTAKNASVLKKNLLRSFASKNRALKHIGSAPLITTSIPLYVASEIFATPTGMLQSSQIGDGETPNQATFGLTVNTDTPSGTIASVKFYFYWKNESDYLAVLNAATTPIILGVMSCSANSAFFGGGNSGVYATAKFTALLGDFETYMPAEIRSITESGNALWYGGTNSQSYPFDGSPVPLSLNNLEVESGEFIFFEVSIEFSYGIENGSITLDFNDDSYGVTSYGVEITLLTPPPSGFTFVSGAGSKAQQRE